MSSMLMLENTLMEVAFIQDSVQGVVTIGRYCSIANNVCYIGFNHPRNVFSTSPIFSENYYLSKYEKNVDDKRKYHSLEIGNDVWIGDWKLLY